MSTNSSAFTIIFGSSSMARRQLLREMGYEFTIMSADIDEKVIRREKPADLVMALAEAKMPLYPGLKVPLSLNAEADATLLITADTINEGFTLDVARGLMLEHPMTLPFVEAVVGTTDTVMGLPKALTEKCILEAL